MLPKVAIVDDERDVAELIAHAFSLAGFECHLAHDGRSALALFSEVRPDVVVLDIVIPDINGREILERFQDTKGTPIFFAAV